MSRTWLYVGGCNRALPYFKTANAKGIAAFAFDEATGEATPAGVMEGVDNPTFLTISPDGRTLYATSEVLGWNEGTVSAYAIDPATGALDYLNKQPTRGSIAAQASFDRTGRYLLVVNYGVGPVTQKPNRSLVVFPLLPDGALGAPIAEATHTGSGPDPARQERPHAHCVAAAPDGRHLVVADLGLDQLVVYRFDGALAPLAPLALPPGSGPRHLAFHPRLPRLYVANELASTAAAVEVGAEGRLSLLQVESTIPAGTGETHCSEIRVSPDGRWLYVANRGHDSLARFSLGADGALTPAGHIGAGGRTPRHFGFDPSGRFVAVANQDSDAVCVFAYEAATGELRAGSVIATGTPTCVAFSRGR